MVSNSELLKFLELAFQRQQHHHNALWEEEKHYSWWIYIIFAALIFVYVNRPLVAWQNVAILAAGSAFGVFISLIGYGVVRRESEYFHQALQTYNRSLIALGLDQRMPHPYGSESLMPRHEIRIQDFNSVKLQANKSLRQLVAAVFKRRKLGIRDCFQLTFLITAFFFIAFAIFSGITVLSQATLT